MAKGEMDYNADAVSAAAGNLLALASLNGMSMWPQGSDSTAMPGKTRAKAEAWTTWPEIGKKSEAMTAAAQQMAAAAGGGLATGSAGVSGVG